MVMVNEFKYEELEEATENFSSSRLIGKGSHGCIYKGVLKDGKLVAVKKPSLGLEKLQDNSKLENEICVLSSLPQNPYLINFLGTSHDSARKRVLVMELMPNGTLHDLLHVAFPPPPWPKRVEIAVQVARGVQLLHEAKPVIIHRDIKSANILFDSNWNAKLGDFGLALRQSCASERVDSVSQPAGTIGYLDPCYTTPCKLSTKNDVFSFGVVLLEIISCTKVIEVSREPASIVEWVLQLIEEHRMSDICDKRLALPSYMESTIQSMLHIASRCVLLEEDHRPSIGEIVTEMENCIVERVRFPIWTNIFHSLIFLNRKRKNTKKQKNSPTTTIICASHHAKVHDDISERKLLIRDVLADTLE
ncbi:serine/threonine-protein kinase-like protein At5g23170 [Cornus florida]|uniref:serine/threonine-protein kinase-like protein At5g23170 n=1 Tax=Cornus florida TaxID=4283 RepID=UPI00289BC0C4|nr:serine/threonine-protein kinase-like protein At5g23170 [Cornus florida]